MKAQSNPKTITNTMLFKQFKQKVLPQITREKWSKVRITVKMDLFQKYVRHLVLRGLLTHAQATHAETKFILKYVTPITGK